MIGYIIAGLALGSIYAIAASSLVVTYVSGGVVNFAFGAMAFAVARFYYWLNSQHGWPIWPAALVSIFVLAPLIGVVLYLLVFRNLRRRSQLIRIVCAIGLSVALPPAVMLIFGDTDIPQAAGLAESPVHVFHVLGTVVDMNQVIIYICLILVVVLGTGVLRFTEAGLRVRALIDSEAMSSLSGISPGRVSLAVWAVSGTLAGLAGILVAPTGGLSASSMTVLMAAAFAPMIAGRLRNLPVAVVVALLMGVVTDVLLEFLPPNSTLTTTIVPSIPFGFILIFLVYYLIRGGSLDEEPAGGSAVDQAIATDEQEAVPVVANHGAEPGSRRSVLTYLPLVAIAAVAVLPLLATGYWLVLVTSGLAMSVALLSFTLVVGYGGIIWLCQITFAGGAAVLAAQLVSAEGWSPLPAAIVASVAMVPIGLLLGALTIRFGDLYVALATLTFGLLVENLVFMSNPFYNFGAGAAIGNPPGFTSTRGFAYLCLIVFAVLAIVITNLRRSTPGMALDAVRWSKPAARTIGLSVLRVQLLVAGLAAFCAGMGGCLIAMNAGAAVPGDFLTFTGLIWLAVLVTIGVRSVAAALVAGLAFTVLPGVFATYIPTRWGSVPSIMFGLGAIGVAANPGGVLAMHGRQIRQLVSKNRRPDNRDGPDEWVTNIDLSPAAASPDQVGPS